MSSRWRRAAAGAMLLGGVFCARLGAQTGNQSAPRVEAPSFDLWASLAVGPGWAASNAGPLPAAQIGLWSSYGRAFVGARVGGASGIIDSDGSYDRALLVGLRGATDATAGSTSFVALGLGSVGGMRRRRDVGEHVGLAGAAEFAASNAFAGLGIAVLGAVNGRTGYAAIGLSLEVGKIH